VRDKVSWDEKEKTLTISKPLTTDDETELKQAVTGKESRQAIEQAAHTSRTTAIEFFQTPSETGERFVVPQIALWVQGELALFDDPEVLDYPWELSRYDATLTDSDLSTLGAAMKVSEGGEIDVDEKSGKVIQRFLPELQRDLGLVYVPEHWDKVQLAKWLCQNLPEQSVTHQSKMAFVAAWIQDFLGQPKCDLGRANLQKFLIRNLIEARIKELRLAAVRNAYQQTLFGEGRESRVAVSDSYTFEFHPQAYAPNRDYDKRFGFFDFRKHYYSRIGDFDSKEEFECAVELDKWAQKGQISFWVRNLVRKEGCSFFLQKADGRFYPDFICKLPDDSILAIEYKGSDRWAGAEDDRLIGNLWAELSASRCRFVMVKDKRWDMIEEKLKT
jgi:type III restriction enzyme